MLELGNRQNAWLVPATLAAGALLAATLSTTADLLIYNPSASVPRGLYVRTETPVRPGAFVTVRAADVAFDYARLRNFTDTGDRFIKRVAASQGQIVCAEGATVSIGGARRVHRFERDAYGRRLPSWNGCRTLSRDEVFLLGDTPDSFDGRYWGPVRRDQIEGVWRPLRP